jgi:hypothetical protein
VYALFSAEIAGFVPDTVSENPIFKAKPSIPAAAAALMSDAQSASVYAYVFPTWAS